MAEDSNDELLTWSKNLDEILKKLSDSNLISVFFLLMGKKSYVENADFISPAKYLSLINQDRIEKESFLKEILQLIHFQSSKDLLIEILWTIKRYDLLKILKVCRHEIQPQHSSLNVIWKSLYEVFEELDFEKDFECIRKTFPEGAIIKEDCLETCFIRSYNEKFISENSLEALLTDLEKERQTSRTWAQFREYYFIRQPTATSPCGLAVIINHENFDGLTLDRRKDSQLDVVALDKLWKSFGFETQIHCDLTKESVLDVFDKLSKKDLSYYDVFVTCYMSHGNEGVVYTSDAQTVPIDYFTDIMANKCKSLINKPKLFFIQACQGTQIQRGVSSPVFSPPTVSLPSDISSNTARYSSVTPLFADVLVAVSSIPGFVSFASDGKNSWFVEALVEKMGQYGHKKSILDVLTKVNLHVCDKKGFIIIKEQLITNCKQIVEQKNTFRKTLKLRKLST